MGEIKLLFRENMDQEINRIKEECPDIYEEYSKTTPVASSITLTFED